MTIRRYDYEVIWKNLKLLRQLYLEQPIVGGFLDPSTSYKSPFLVDDMHKKMNGWKGVVCGQPRIYDERQ